MKKKIWFGPALILGLVLSYNTAWGQACTISTVVTTNDATIDDSRAIEGRIPAVGLEGSGSFVFATDTRGSTGYFVRGVFSSSGAIPSPLAAPPGSIHEFSSAYPVSSSSHPNIALDLAFNREGSFLFTDGSRIGKISSDRSALEYVAEGFVSANSIAVDSNDNIYFSGKFSSDPPATGYDGLKIFKMTPSGSLSVVAEGLRKIYRLAITEGGDIYYLGLAGSPGSALVVRKISPDGMNSIVAGSTEGSTLGDNGPATAASLGVESASLWFGGLALDGNGNIYIGAGYRIRKVSPNGIIITIAGNGTRGVAFPTSGERPALEAQLGDIDDIAIDSQGNLYLANNQWDVRHIDKITCRRPADLRLYQAAASRRRAGSPFSLNFTVSNDGPDAAVNVVLRDTLPSGLNYVSYRGAGGPVTCSSSGRNVTCNFSGAIPSGQRRTVIINVQAPRRGTFSNDAEVRSDTADPNMDNNRVITSLSVN